MFLDALNVANHIVVAMAVETFIERMTTKAAEPSILIINRLNVVLSWT